MTARPGTQPEPGSPAGPGGFPAIRAALDRCAHTGSDGKQIAQAATAELEAARELAAALRALSGHIPFLHTRGGGIPDDVADRIQADYEAATAALARLEAKP